MNNSRTLWFPVFVKREIRSKIEVGEIRNKWVAGEFGRPKAAQILWRAYNGLPKLLETAEVRGEGNPAIVRVPALGIELLYMSSAQGDYFVLAKSYLKIPDLPTGKLLPADTLLIRLSQPAQPVREDVVR